MTDAAVLSDLRTRLAAFPRAPLALLPTPIQSLANFGQLLGGLALLFGPFARFAAVLAMVFLVAELLLNAKYAQFFTDAEGGLEYTLAMSALCVVVFTHGPGLFFIEFKSKGKD